MKQNVYLILLLDTYVIWSCFETVWHWKQENKQWY